MRKKGQGQWSLIVKAAIAVLIIIVGYFFINTYVLKRGGGAVEQVGFAKLDDTDQDGVQNFYDICCPAVCNPRGTPVEQYGDFRGCTAQQGATLCEFTGPQCNSRPTAVPQGTPVAGTPAAQPTG